MTSKITALREGFVTDLTFEWTVSRVLAEMVTQVTALVEDCLATSVLAAEVQLEPLARVVANAHNVVPLVWNAIE